MVTSTLTVIGAWQRAAALVVDCVGKGAIAQTVAEGIQRIRQNTYRSGLYEYHNPSSSAIGVTALGQVLDKPARRNCNRRTKRPGQGAPVSWLQ